MENSGLPIFQISDKINSILEKIPSKNPYSIKIINSTFKAKSEIFTSALFLKEGEISHFYLLTKLGEKSDFLLYEDLIEKILVYNERDKPYFIIPSIKKQFFYLISTRGKLSMYFCGDASCSFKISKFKENIGSLEINKFKELTQDFETIFPRFLHDNLS